MSMASCSRCTTLQGPGPAPDCLPFALDCLFVGQAPSPAREAEPPCSCIGGWESWSGPGPGSDFAKCEWVADCPHQPPLIASRMDQNRQTLEIRPGQVERGKELPGIGSGRPGVGRYIPSMYCIDTYRALACLPAHPRGDSHPSFSASQSVAGTPVPPDCSCWLLRRWKILTGSAPPRASARSCFRLSSRLPSCSHTRVKIMGWCVLSRPLWPALSCFPLMPAVFLLQATSSYNFRAPTPRQSETPQSRA